MLQLITTTNRRGAETFAVDLASQLGGHGFDVETVALTTGTGAALLDVPHLGERRLGRRTLVELRRRSVLADVIVAHGSTTLPAAVIATIGRRVPIIYRSIGDIDQWNTQGFRRFRTRVLLRRSSMVVALSDRAAASLHALGVSSNSLCTIPNGVAVERYPRVDSSARAAARADLGIACSALAAVVGALEPEKDVGTAIRAVATIDGLHLVIAGDGSCRSELEQLARSLAPGRVHFAGRVPNSAAILAAADLLVLPSLTEGVPAVAIEAGLTGLPTVASQVGFVEDVVVDGTTGALVAPGDVAAFADAMSSALRSKERLGAAARERCTARFSMQAISCVWAALLHELAEGDEQGASDL